MFVPRNTKGRRMSSAFILTRDERNTIVAALTLYQRHIDSGGPLPEDIAHIACGGDEKDVDPIIADELQSLIDSMKGAVDVDGTGRDIGIELQKILHAARQIEQSTRNVYERVPDIIEEDDDEEIIVTASGLHPANTVEMDRRTRAMMVGLRPWPGKNLPMKRRTDPMNFGHIRESVTDGVPFVIEGSDGFNHRFDTVDEALEAGWTVD